MLEGGYAAQGSTGERSVGSADGDVRRSINILPVAWPVIKRGTVRDSWRNVACRRCDVTKYRRYCAPLRPTVPTA